MCVCDNCKTAVISHKKYEWIVNTKLDKFYENILYLTGIR